MSESGTITVALVPVDAVEIRDRPAGGPSRFALSAFFSAQASELLNLKEPYIPRALPHGPTAGDQVGQVLGDPGRWPPPVAGVSETRR